MLSSQIELRVTDYFNSISNEIKNLNPAQQGRVIFDFQNKNSITIGGLNKTSIEERLSDPTATGFIDGSYLVDDTLDADLKIADRSITNAKIKLAALTGELIALGTITETLISDNAISTGKIQTNAIVSTKIAAGEIKAINMIADQAVITGSIQIQDAIVIEAKIGNLAVSTAKIGALAVTNAKINDMSVAKLTAGTITSIQITVSGTGWIRSSNYSAGTTGFSIDSDGDAEFNSVVVRGTIAAGTVTSGSYLEIGDYSVDDEAIKLYISTRPRIEFKYDGSSVGYIEGYNYSGTIAGVSVDVDAIKISDTLIVGTDVVIGDDLIVVDDGLIGGDLNVNGTMSFTSSGLMKLPVGTNKYT